MNADQNGRAVPDTHGVKKAMAKTLSVVWSVALSCCVFRAGAVADPPAPSKGDHGRADYPLDTSRWAIPSDTGAYRVNLIGGGSARRRRADPPLQHEGTWGWDYRGW